MDLLNEHVYCVLGGGPFTTPKMASREQAKRLDRPAKAGGNYSFKGFSDSIKKGNQAVGF